VQTDTGNCGACGAVCAPAHVTTPVCTSGQCTYTGNCTAHSTVAGFIADWLDCDGNRANGCESAPNAQATCGQCPSVCVPPAVKCADQGVQVGNCTPSATECLSYGAPFGYACLGTGITNQ
jgi:hypothetical protein